MACDDREAEGFAGAIPWQRIFQHLGLAFGWTPNEISELTIAQVWFYLSEAREGGQTVHLQPAEARQLSQRLKQHRKHDDWHKGG